ncbi:MAG: TIM barrel protein [Planctomycetota bacterium]|nr:TIM barrel protein [Planctomycetota bacterium]
MTRTTRRRFLRQTVHSSAALLAAGPLAGLLAGERSERGDRGSKMNFGLVTYQWGKNWTLPELIEECAKAGALGVELRTTHAHGVEPRLDARERREVKKRFDDSPVTLVGLGSNERFDSPDPTELKAAIEKTRAFIRLSHDVGGSGVKVKPDSFHKGVPHEKTVEQIGRALNTVGKFGADHGQQIRLEVHGQCAALPVIRQILDVADHPNVAICWNSNEQDLQGKGLEHNFELVKDRFGKTVHVRPFDSKEYPYEKLMGLLVAMDYDGWVLLEDGRVPADPARELRRQRQLFIKLRALAREGGKG